ncbi:MAG TPA: STAS domain-containing protein [Gemmataceae bacterium]|nr:STAS domain-containing protein [Gemmataceae bacterium]
MPLHTPSHPQNVTFDGPRAVIRVSDAHLGSAGDTAPGQRLYRLIEGLDRSDVALDFENVRFLSSIGLSVLLTLHKQLRAAGGRLAILNVQPPIWEIFVVTRLVTVLDVHPKDAPAPV